MLGEEECGEPRWRRTEKGAMAAAALGSTPMAIVRVAIESEGKTERGRTKRQRMRERERSEGAQLLQVDERGDVVNMPANVRTMRQQTLACGRP